MISRGIETVTKGMMALLDYQDVTAHNLANVTTDGYKKSNITFQDVMQANITTKTTDDKTRKVGTLSNGVRTDRTYIDFSQGGLSETGNKTDLAFDGNGFFKVIKLPHNIFCYFCVSCHIGVSTLTSQQKLATP